MTAAAPLKVFSQLRDLEIYDCEHRLCGIADEVEFTGGPGGPLKISALLVGPGAYDTRLPAWAAGVIWRFAGRRLVRIPWPAVEHVTSRITLNRTAAELGLAAVDRRLASFFAKVPGS